MNRAASILRLSGALGLCIAGCQSGPGGSEAGVPDGMGVAPPVMLAATDPAALMTTLVELQMLGEKKVGTGPGQQAGEYVRKRLVKAGLGDVHGEAFNFPRHDVISSSLVVTVGGVALSPQPGFDVFEASGSGSVEGDVVATGTATDVELKNLDLTGKVALVNRSRSYHRSSQYRNLIAKGAVAMLYISAAPENLRQVGSVRLNFEGMGAIPAVTIGATDGAALEAALKAGKATHATIAVSAVSTPASGQNFLGRIVGKDPSHEVVIGAHYDTWFAGSSDNGGGIAALLALAERRVKKAQPARTLVFVAYDGEEVALYGGDDFLRRHRVLTEEPILAVINFEVPAVKSSTLFGLARSNQDALDKALTDAGLGQLYPLYAAMELVPTLFGGIIPTDIQGIYRSGVPTASTAVDSPYYHTTADTPDKVDVDFLAQVVDSFDVALDEIVGDEAIGFAQKDRKLWTADVKASPRAAGMPLSVDVTVRDAAGTLEAGAPVQAILFHDDFFETRAVRQLLDAQGHATFTFSAADADQGQGHRYVHVTSGPTFPFVEQIVALP